MPSSELHRAVGQLITGKVAGLELDDETARAIKDGDMGGVTLFKDNARDLAQLFDLCTEIHALSQSLPLITVDQEGGAVQRFDHVITPLPSPLSQAASGDFSLIESIAALSARQLRLLGVNCNLTPVLDVNSNPLNPIIATRSFGDNPELIGEIGSVVAAAHIKEGVLPVGKHFPGHGDTFEDSHMALAVARGDKDTLQSRELAPFIAAADALPAILVGHIWLPAYEDTPIPATLSSIVTNGLLRETIGFQKFLVTDDFPVMRAIMDNWGLEEASILAIKAGIDNVLVSGTIEQIRSVHSALMKAVASGVISERELANSLKRRAEALRICTALPTQSLERRKSDLHQSLSDGPSLVKRASAAGTVVVHGVLPNIVNDRLAWLVVAPDHPRYKLDLCTAIRHLVSDCSHVESTRYPINPQDSDIKRISELSVNKKCILLTYRALLNKGQLELAAQLESLGTPAVVVAVDVPYELSKLSRWSCRVATLDPSDLAIDSLAAALTGRLELTGKLPVSL